MPSHKQIRIHHKTKASPKHLTCRARQRSFGQGRFGEPVQESVPNAIAARIREVLSVASRVASMPDREAIHRYHFLTDKSLAGSLSPTERFELERIEARLDAAHRDPLIEARNRELAGERAEILDSIRTLLTKLQS